MKDNGSDTLMASAFTTNSLRETWIGLAAMTSGGIGIISTGFLIAFLSFRSAEFYFSLAMLRCHDIGLIFQFLAWIPVVLGLHKLAATSAPLAVVMRFLGVASLLLIALSMTLIFPGLVNDTYYTFPQGLFGVWIVLANWKLKSILPRWLRWFGIVVGTGLTLVGTFVPVYAIFVDPIILQIPAATLEEQAKIPTDTTANIVLHQILWIGSIMGVFPLPIWTFLLGWRLNVTRNAKYSPV